MALCARARSLAGFWFATPNEQMARSYRTPNPKLHCGDFFLDQLRYSAANENLRSLQGLYE